VGPTHGCFTKGGRTLGGRHRPPHRHPGRFLS
jgi:hypothetical protein